MDSGVTGVGGGGRRAAPGDTIQGEWLPNESLNILPMNLEEHWTNDHLEQRIGWKWWR